MIDWTKQQLFKETYRRGIDPNDLFLVKRCGGDFSVEGKALFEVLEPSSDTPIWLVKANRSQQGNARLKAEFDRLQSFRNGTPDDLWESLPVPLVLEERPTGSVSIETFLPGIKISTYLQKGDPEGIWKNWKSYGRAGLKWLERYNEVVTHRETRLDRSWYRKVILDPLGRSRNQWVDLLPEGSEIIDCLEGTEVDFDLTLMTPSQHGDFTPGNLIAMEGHLGVIDWSPVDSTDPPLMDLFHFLLSSGIYMSRGLGTSPSNVILDPRFWEEVQTEICELFLQAGLPAHERGPVFRAACWKKIEGYLTQPRIVESSLAVWTQILADGGMARIENEIFAI